MIDASAIEIRHSRLTDAESFQRCLDRVARERRHLAMVEAPSLGLVRAFIEALPEGPSVQFLAVDRADVVGWCDIVANRREGFGHSGALGMGLLPDYRGHGLGRRLLESALQAVSEVGLSRVELEVFGANAPAIALYRALGFEREGVKRGARILDGRIEDILCMARVLRTAS